jgi:subtilisin family serine protease
MRKTILTLFLVILSQLTAWAGSDRVVVEIPPGMKASAVAASVGGTVVDSIPGTQYYLIKVPSAAAVARHLSAVSAELDDAVALRPTGTMAILRTSARQSADWYAEQPAFKLIRADKALDFARGRSIIVADINSRIDFGHPSLRGKLSGGYDFVAERASRGFSLDQSSASFLDQSSAAFLDQSSAAFLDQSSASFLDNSTAAFLDQSTASFLDQSSASFLDAGNPAHGHATICAGLIAAVAPDAMIMPLRAFDDSGQADAFVIARAIYYAVEHGADVINMSFGMTSRQKVLRKAIDFAVERGVTVVASAGNNNTDVPQFPAAYKGVIAVAATDLNDKKAGFSNYGDSIYVDAPGVNMISAYPGGFFAIASGTSFAAPLVAGEAALARSMHVRDADKAVAKGAVNIDRNNPGYAGELGHGRIDMVRTLKGPRNNDR